MHELGWQIIVLKKIKYEKLINTHNNYEKQTTDTQKEIFLHFFVTRKKKLFYLNKHGNDQEKHQV